MFSFTIWLTRASHNNFLLTKWNKFSIGFRLGDLAGILNTFAPMLVKVHDAFREFCTGSPSCNIRLALGLIVTSNASGN